MVSQREWVLGHIAGTITGAFTDDRYRRRILQYQKDIFATNQDQDLNSNLVYHHITIVFSGEISLRGEKRPKKADGQITKGNVYLDGHPICDDGWTREDATVACR